MWRHLGDAREKQQAGIFPEKQKATCLLGGLQVALLPALRDASHKRGELAIIFERDMLSGADRPTNQVGPNFPHSPDVG